jgi:hypothetical protein
MSEAAFFCTERLLPRDSDSGSIGAPAGVTQTVFRPLFPLASLRWQVDVADRFRGRLTT